MKLGIYEKAINKRFSWKDKIIMAKKAGFDFIEFSVDETPAKLNRLEWSNQKIKKLKEVLVEENFHLNSMCFSALRSCPYGHHDSKIREKAITITTKAILLAKKLGIRTILLTGNEFYWVNHGVLIKKNIVESLKIVTQIANKHSVMLTLEPMECHFMGTITKLKKVLGEVKSPWLNITLDIGNLYQFAKEKLEEEITKGATNFVGTQFKDSLPNKFRNVVWGKGNVDFSKVMNLLKQVNYTGPHTIEMWSSNKPSETFKQNLKNLKSAKVFFDKQF